MNPLNILPLLRAGCEREWLSDCSQLAAANAAAGVGGQPAPLTDVTVEAPRKRALNLHPGPSLSLLAMWLWLGKITLLRH